MGEGMGGSQIARQPPPPPSLENLEGTEVLVEEKNVLPLC